MGGRYDTEVPSTLAPCPEWRAVRAEKPDYVVVYGWTAWLYVLQKLRAWVLFDWHLFVPLTLRSTEDFAGPIRCGVSLRARCDFRIAASLSPTNRRACFGRRG